MNQTQKCRRPRVKKLLLFLVSIIMIHSANAQNPVLSLDSQLHHTFQYVTNPDPFTHYFYDIAAHITDSAFYQANCPDTGNVYNWYMMYSETYYSAYDSTGLPTDTAMYYRASARLTHDTIPIGIIDVRYNLLTPTALASDTFFSFDTVNDLLYDQATRPYAPYTIETEFAASALTNSCFFTDPVFEISPSFMLKDVTYGGDGPRLKIDFGDGNGWVAFDGTMTQYYRVPYNSGGLKTITAGVFTGGVLTETSISTIYISQSLAKLAVPSTPLPFTAPGLSVTGYQADSCRATEGGSAPIVKYVVYLEGIDFADQLGWANQYFSRTPDVIYNQMISSDTLSQLMDYGYTFIVVKYNNSFSSMEQNAMYVVGLLDTIKKYGMYNCGCDNPPPSVVIGESMSGVIGRYALRYMETPAYTGSTSRFRPELMHNTRLFITVDAPQQGANVPLGYQHLYNFFASSPFLQSIFQVLGLQQATQFLNADATQELLKYHIKTDSHPGFNVSTSTYGPSALSTHFWNNLAAMGNYPKYLKMVAVSNGSFRGKGQISPFTGTYRVANDHLFAGYLATGINVHHHHVFGTSDSIQVNTNPNGTGVVFYAEHKIYTYSLHLFWFGITLRQHTPVDVLIKKTAQDVLPYCVSAASNLRLDPDGFPSGNFTLPSIWNTLFGVQFAYTSGGPTFSLSLSVGSSWLVQGTAALNLYTDGFDFGFIPVASSMDYNNATYMYNTASASDLAYDIFSDPPATTLAQTPYDVLMPNPSIINHQHLQLDNPGLQYCTTCTAAPNPVRSYLVNREIGDDSLLLFNTHDTLVWEYEAEHDVLIDFYNLYYNYPSSASPFIDFTGVTQVSYPLSKENPCQFSYNIFNPTKIQANYTVLDNGAIPYTGYYRVLPGTMHICCVNYGQELQQRAAHPLTVQTLNGSSFAKIYPNPVTENSITVDYKFKDNFPVTIMLYDIRGAIIGMYTPGFPDNTKECNFPINLPSGIAAGMYFVKISNGVDIMNSRIIVTPN